jgi:uncharacterized protein
MPLPQRFHLLAKPTGAACNLDCKYCFFLSKEALYPGDRFRMSDETLDAYIGQLLDAHPDEVTIAWQGGEPTLMGLDFFRRPLACVERHRRPGQRILHSIQTNGTLLDDAWCAFFKEHHFLVGLSVDGPRELHNAYRVDKGGAGSFDRVMRAWGTLRRHEVEVNILCAVHAANAGRPIDVYRFFRDKLQARYMQFIPILERTTGSPRPLYTERGSLVTGRSVGAQQFGRFLSAIFDEWVRRDVGKVFVQAFDAALGNWLGRPSLCIFSPTCGGALALEHNGDLYSCDHYVEPGYLLGNIMQTPMAELVASAKQRAFGQDKLNSLPKYCRECGVRFACHGECPRNRFIATPDGEPGLNYLCAGYKLFFDHIGPAIETMAALLRQGRLAGEIMPMHLSPDARHEPAETKVGRNDPCPCGSGIKFKHCHG